MARMRVRDMVEAGVEGRVGGERTSADEGRVTGSVGMRCDSGGGSRAQVKSFVTPQTASLPASICSAT